MDWKTEAQYRAELCRVWELYETTKAALDAAQEKLDYAQKVEALLEPVGWQYYQDGKWWYGDDSIKDHRKNTEEAGYLTRDVYAAPQYGEKQPSPDVVGLVEALEWYSEHVLGCRKTTSEGEQYRTALDRDGGARARAALAAYQKQEESNGTA